MPHLPTRQPPSPRVTIKQTRRGVFIGRPRIEHESQPALVVRKDGRDQLILTLGKHIRPRDVRPELSNKEISELRKAILIGIDSIASQLPKRMAGNRYLVVGVKRGRLARKNGGSVSTQKIGFEVPPGLRVVVPRAAKPLVTYFDGIVQQSEQAKRMRQIRRVYRIRQNLQGMFQRAPNTHDLFKRKKAKHIVDREQDILDYLRSIPYVWRNPAYFATVLNGIENPLTSERIIDLIYSKGDPLIPTVKSLVHKRRSIRNVPKPKEIEWFIRGFYRKDPLFRHYDIFPRRIPTLDPEVPF